MSIEPKKNQTGSICSHLKGLKSKFTKKHININSCSEVLIGSSIIVNEIGGLKVCRESGIFTNKQNNPTCSALKSKMPPAPQNSIESAPRSSRSVDVMPKRIQRERTGNNISAPSFNMSTNSETNQPTMSATSRTIHELINTVNFNREVERLRTFSDWPVSYLNPSDMAAAGFYYTRRRDIVRCAFCGVEVGCWEEGDNPMEDHKKWSPKCRFIRKLPVGNVPISCDNGSSDSRDSNGGYDVCGTGEYGIMFRSDNILPNADIPSIENLGIQPSRPPSFPAYATYESRLRSYETWPISLKLKADVLSEAGFFYTGKGDQTICYYCGGGLKDWEEADQPWEEHARWFSKCYFVLLIKGKEYVENISKKPEDSSSGYNSDSGLSSSECCTSLQRKSDASTSESKPGSISGTNKLSDKEIDICKEEDDIKNNDLCKICFQEERGIVFLPCGHIVACPKCALSLTTCAVCRKPFTATVRAFLS